MTLSVDTIARFTANVAAMTGEQRSDRMAEQAAINEPGDEAALEFVKCLCGPDATGQDIVNLMVELEIVDPPPTADQTEPVAPDTKIWSS
jgi:hypothetical protein